MYVGPCLAERNEFNLRSPTFPHRRDLLGRTSAAVAASLHAARWMRSPQICKSVFQNEHGRCTTSCYRGNLFEGARTEIAMARGVLPMIAIPFPLL